MEILFDGGIVLFSLSICLRMICDKGIAFDFQENIECFHKRGYKLRSLIRDHFQWGAMKLEYVVSEYGDFL